ncbi:MAG: hypothetical protein AAGM22_23245 [Acidobacteriota bacterium]
MLSAQQAFEVLRRSAARAALFALAALLAPAAVAQNPSIGAEDPLANPSLWTLFPSDELLIPATNQVASFFRPIRLDAEVNGGVLTDWDVELADSDRTFCTSSRMRLAAGRVVDPSRSDLVCASANRLEVVSEGDGGRSVLSTDFFGVGFQTGRSVGLAVADLDRALGDDARVHDEIAVSYVDVAGRAKIRIYDHELDEKASLETVFSVDQERSEGGAELTASDVDGDGVPEIVAVLKTADSSSGQGGLWTLSAFTYTPPGPEGGDATLEEMGQDPEDRIIRPSPSGRVVSAAVESADIDGDGQDEIVVLWYGDGENILYLEIFDVTRQNNNLVFTAEGDPIEVGDVVPGSFADLADGLLRLENGGDLRRRQLVTVHARPDGQSNETVVSVYEWNGDSVVQLATLGLGRSAVGGVGPGVAVSNFVGLANDDSLDGQIAIGIPAVPEGPAPTIDTYFYPSLITLALAEDGGLVELHDTLTWPDLTSAGVEWAQSPIAYDRDGDSLYLGSPIHFTIENNVTPEMVIQEPPKHIDYLPVDTDDFGGDREIVNVSASPAFFVALEDEESQALDFSSAKSTDWTIGGGVNAGVTKSVEMSSPLGSVGLEVSASTSIDYAYNEQFEGVNTSYGSTSFTTAVATEADDYLRYLVDLLNVWRYPLYGPPVTGDDGTQLPDVQGYFELIVPGPEGLGVSTGGRVVTWYQPRHVNNNILSYPQFAAELSAANFGCDGDEGPGDIGPYSVGIDSESFCQPMNDSVLRTWGGIAETFELTITEEDASSTSKSWEHKLGEQADFQVTATTKVELPVFGAKQETTVTAGVNFHNENSWGEATVSTDTISSARSISLAQPSGPTAMSYQYITLIYATIDGHLKVAHSVNLPSGSLGFWKDYYTRPDPGVGLPHRFVFDGSDWSLADGLYGRQMRGLTVYAGETDTVGVPVIVDEATDGDSLTVEARVFNFSVFTAAAFDVSFHYQLLDPVGVDGMGELGHIGTTSLTLDPLGTELAKVTWNTEGLGVLADGVLDGVNKYRILVTVDPCNKVKDEVHDGVTTDVGEGDTASNNVGYWPWGGNGFIIKPSAEDSGDPLLAPTLKRRRGGFDHDAQVAADGLSIRQANGEWAAARGNVGGGCHSVRLRIDSDAAVDHELHLAFFEEVPVIRNGELVRGERRAFSRQTISSLQPGPNYHFAFWCPSGEVFAESPQVSVTLSAEVDELLDDVLPANAVDSLPVEVYSRGWRGLSDPRTTALKNDEDADDGNAMCCPPGDCDDTGGTP